MTTASADVPLKGLVPLLEALAKLRTERPADLVVVGRPAPRAGWARPSTAWASPTPSRFVSGVSDDRMVELYAEASVAVVPSLYEGFSLPAIEAMACGVPLVATTGGALPEVVGTDGETGLLVPPGDPGALAWALGRVLDDPALQPRAWPRPAGAGSSSASPGGPAPRGPSSTTAGSSSATPAERLARGRHAC